MRDEPRPTGFEIGSQAHRVHAPADATRMLERASNQLIERMRKQLALADRREERERGDDRLRRNAALDRFRYSAGCQLPEAFSRIPELRGDCRLRQRGKSAESADAELTEAAMRDGIERQNRDGLGSEKRSLITCIDNDRFARLGAAGRDPSGELSHSPTQSNGLTVGRPDGLMNCFDDFLWRSEYSFESINPYVCEAQLRLLDDGTHFAQGGEQSGKLFVVMHGIGLEEPECRAETDRLADRHPRFHAGMTSE